MGWYVDSDGDGFGNASTYTMGCSGADGTITDGTDCDDANPDVYPGADEYCNDIDDDCDGTVDNNDPVDGDWYAADSDGDGFGAVGEMAWACDGPDNQLDCNDSDEYEPQVVDSGADLSMANGSSEYPWPTINGLSLIHI